MLTHPYQMDLLPHLPAATTCTPVCLTHASTWRRCQLLASPSASPACRWQRAPWCCRLPRVSAAAVALLQPGRSAADEALHPVDARKLQPVLEPPPCPPPPCRHSRRLGCGRVGAHQPGGPVGLQQHAMVQRRRRPRGRHAPGGPAGQGHAGSPSCCCPHRRGSRLGAAVHGRVAGAQQRMRSACPGSCTRQPVGLPGGSMDAGRGQGAGCAPAPRRQRRRLCCRQPGAAAEGAGLARRAAAGKAAAPSFCPFSTAQTIPACRRLASWRLRRQCTCTQPPPAPCPIQRLAKAAVRAARSSSTCCGAW